MCSGSDAERGQGVYRSPCGLGESQGALSGPLWKGVRCPRPRSPTQARSKRSGLTAEIVTSVPSSTAWRSITAFFSRFIRDGLDNRERAFHLVDPARREDHLKRLTDAGIDVEEALASGQLEVRPWEDGPLHGERFDQDTWLAAFEEVLRSGRASGYATTRFLAQMEWALVDMPGIDAMMEFETRVNYVVPKYDDPVICAYDLSKFGASTVMYALRTHPVVIIGALLQENPFYVDPDQLLLELRDQQLHVGRGLEV